MPEEIDIINVAEINVSGTIRVRDLERFTDRDEGTTDYLSSHVLHGNPTTSELVDVIRDLQYRVGSIQGIPTIVDPA